MKAIRQIIDYLRGEGILSRDQLALLAHRGVLPDPEQLDDDDYDCPCCPRSRHSRQEDGDAFDPDDPEHDLFDPLPRTKRPSRSSGRPKGRSLTAAGLCARLADIRNSAPDELTRILGQALARRELSWDAFWNAVGLDDYVTVVGDRGLHGPAISAYRVALASNADALDQVRKYNWLLRYAETRHVFNLRQAQRKMIRAWGALLADGPDQIGTVIAQSRDKLGYWTSVLIYSARRCHDNAPQRLHGDERRAPRARPDHPSDPASYLVVCHRR
jgi:hypothetical protein